MNMRGGFTIVELIITLTIMAILMSLAVVNLTSTLAKGRDEERRTDVSNIILYQETAYNRSTTKTYFTNTAALTPGTNATVEAWYQNLDRNNLRAPGVAASTYSVVAASNNVQTTGGVMPQPTNTTYVYQPIENDGTVCNTVNACRKFNIYYREESTGTIVMMTSRSQ
jgi:prepilin-type N-terminal cleavage/methylation domain-containing protein